MIKHEDLELQKEAVNELLTELNAKYRIAFTVQDNYTRFTIEKGTPEQISRGTKHTNILYYATKKTTREFLAGMLSGLAIIKNTQNDKPERDLKRSLSN
jgi:hypothetical protein